MIDTHTHIYDEAFDTDRTTVIQRAIDAGVTTMLLPAIDSQSLERQEQLTSQYPHLFRQMMGLHPTSVDDNFETELAIVQQRLFDPQRHYVAVGEIGLDLYWDSSHLEQQCEVLLRQMRWAETLEIPVALHIRKAHNDLFGILRQINRSHYDGVMHCFGGSVQEAERYIEMGFYIGIGGVVTFKNATLAKVAATIPLERIVLETDAPYLAPNPYRGQRNEPAYLTKIAATIASLRNIMPEEVDLVTSNNARRLFHRIGD